MTYRFLFALALAVCTAAPVLAQAPSATGAMPGVREYARPGYPTMTLRVWSSGGSSGIWRVERDVDFIELLTVLGAGATETNRQVRVNIRVFRGDAANRERIYEARLVDILNAETQPPTLQDEDIVYIETRQRRITFQGVTSVIGAASSVAILLFRITRVF